MTTDTDPGGEPAAAQTPAQDITARVVLDRPPWFMPETRTLIVAGLFLMGWRIIEMIASQPSLATNTLFVTVATTICGAGGIGAVVGFFFIASKKDRKAEDSSAGGAQ